MGISTIVPLLTSGLTVNVVGVVVAFAAIFYAFCTWKFSYWASRNVPFFPPSIPFGNVQSPFTNKIHFGKILGDMYKKAKAKGYRHLGAYFMWRATYIPVDLDLIKQIMTKDFQHFMDKGIYTNEKDDPVGCHLFAIGGTKWRNLRMKLTPTFTSGKMKGMFQTLVDCGLILEKYLLDYSVKSQAVNIKDILSSFSTDIIGSCAFGLNCNSFKEPDSDLRVYSQKIFKSSNKFRSFVRGLILQSHTLARALRLRQVPKDVNEFFINLVQDTVNYRLKNGYVRNDFLQMLIDMWEKNEQGKKGTGGTLTMDEIAAQSFVFFIAGFETSATTMTFALFELASNPDIQEKVRDEIKTVLAKHDGKMTYDSINEMKYLGQVIDETLRMYPPIPALQRSCTLEYKVPGEDTVLEEGTRVIIPVLGIHYDPEYYKNPKMFDPDRFSDENKKIRHPYAHLPFGEGPRLCIGQRFGIMQSKVGLVCVLKNFNVTLNEKTEVPLKISPRTFVTSVDGGIWLNLKRL